MRVVAVQREIAAIADNFHSITETPALIAGVFLFIEPNPIKNHP